MKQRNYSIKRLNKEAVSGTWMRRDEYVSNMYRDLYYRDPAFSMAFWLRGLRKDIMDACIRGKDVLIDGRPHHHSCSRGSGISW
jgi:hypothetical protein